MIPPRPLTPAMRRALGQIAATAPGEDAGVTLLVARLLLIRGLVERRAPGVLAGGVEVRLTAAGKEVDGCRT